MVVSLVLTFSQGSPAGAVTRPAGSACPDRDDRERFVHLLNEAAWLAEYPHELTVFPKGKHDDQVDSTAQMLDCWKRA